MEDSNFNLLALDCIDSISKMQNLDKKSFEYTVLHLRLLGNLNKMCEVINND